MKESKYAVNLVSPEQAEILIYDEIGVYPFADTVTLKQFAKDLKGLKDAKNITVRIHSPGGQVFEGFAIYDLLRQHPARKTVMIDGLAASIASVIAMAGDEIIMAENAEMMIHEAWGGVLGYAEDMRKYADMLDSMSGKIRRAYNRTKRPEAEIVAMMKEETWMDPTQALELGFVDAIAEPLQMAAHFDLAKFKYRKIPGNFAKENNIIRQKLAKMSIRSQKARAASGS
jgi:ATP-dependent protease ClpP protease subunit